MLYKGESFVPPNCPALEVGHAATIEKMEFLYDSTLVDRDDGAPAIETIAQFFERDTPNDADWTTVSTYALWPTESSVGEQAAALIDEIQTQHIKDRVREIMCSRVAECRGIVGNECWAIGETALIEIHQQIITELKPDQT